MSEPAEPSAPTPNQENPRVARETPAPDPTKIRIGDNVVIEGTEVGKVVGLSVNGEPVVSRENQPKRPFPRESLSPLPKKPQP